MDAASAERSSWERLHEHRHGRRSRLRGDAIGRHRTLGRDRLVGPGDPGSLVRGGKIRAITVDQIGRIWVGYPGAANSAIDYFERRPRQGYRFETVPQTTGLDIWQLVAHGDSVWALTDHDLRLIDRGVTTPFV